MDPPELDQAIIFNVRRQIQAPEARQRYLQEACGANQDLLAQVQALLRVHEEEQSFLQSPAVTTIPASPSDGEGPDAQIGPYKLLEKLGEGGMGVVWVAEQDQPVKRRVALKVIKPGMDSHRVITRFETERQALALMNHTNIAKVLDAGSTPSGRPYFVMELVQGVPITRYCDDLQLSVPERLELFVPVCQALQHAHQKGIIHRDVKPSNVLIARQDGRPVPKVIDFGVAKALHQRLTEQSVFTEIGQVVGTLEYMSPEQAEASALDIDTRADVYALGVLLYELLTGTTPLDRKRFQKAAYLELLRVIREEEPPKPSTRLSQSPDSRASVAAQRRTEPGRLTKEVRGDLDWIVMKCLEKDRTRRYETANALVRDVERHLHDDPVEACPPSARYRLGKFLRKHRAGVATTAACGLLLLLGAVVSTWQAIRALRAEAVAVRERDEKERANADLAVALTAEAHRRQQAREALDALSSQIVEDRLARQQTQELTDEQKRFLQKALDSYEAFARDTGQDEATRAGVAAAHNRVGNIRSKLGQLADAETAFRRGVEQYARLAADIPTVPDYRQGLAKSHIALGRHLANTGRPQEAEAAYREALAIQKHLAGDFSTVPGYRADLAQSHNNLGLLLAETGRPREAEAAYRDALAVQKHLAADFPTVRGYRQELARHHNNLALLQANTGRPQEAEAAYADALAIQKQLAADFPTVPDYRSDLARYHSNLGLLLANTGRPQEAEAVYAEALATQKQLAADFPTVPGYRQELARHHNNLGILLANIGRSQEAETAYADARAIQKQLAADFPSVPGYRQELARYYNNLGLLLANTGRPQKVESSYRDALALRKQLAADFPTVPAHRQELAASYATLGWHLVNTGRPQEAEAAYHDALAILKQLAADFPMVPNYRQELAQSRRQLGTLLLNTGRSQEAEAAYRAALDLHKHLAADFPTVPGYRNDLARSHHSLSNLLADTGRPQEAEGDLRAALALKKQLAADFPSGPGYRQDLAVSYHCLGLLLAETGRPQEAEAAYRDALALQKHLAADFPTVPGNRQELARSHKNLGHLLKSTGRPQEAEAACREALVLVMPLTTDFPSVPDYQFLLADTMVLLGNLLCDRKEYAAARQLFDGALPHNQAALKGNARDPEYRVAFRENREGLTRTLVEMGEHSVAAVTAFQLLEAAGTPANDAYVAAGYLARCIPLAEKDKRLADAQRHELAQGYAAQAMAALRQAIRNGYHDVAKVKNDPNLHPLRSRADFQKLLAELEDGKGKETK